MRCRTAIYGLIGCALCRWLGACDVHVFPKVEEQEVACQLCIALTEIEMGMDTIQQEEDGQWSVCSDEQAIAHRLTDGRIRFVVNCYAESEQHGQTAESLLRSYTFVQALSEGYTCRRRVMLPTGRCRVMVWADMLPPHRDSAFYDASDFHEIALQGLYEGNTDYRDAFCGDTVAELVWSKQGQEDTIRITMNHAVAKWELLSTDVELFVNRETQRLHENDKDGTATPMDWTAYRVVFRYSGYTPSAYSLFSQAPVDARTGLVCQAGFTMRNAEEVSCGFDYVFSDTRSSVQVQMAVYDSIGTEVALTEPIDIPLARGRHTVVRGNWIGQHVEGGVRIDSNYEGEFNVYL